MAKNIPSKLHGNLLLLSGDQQSFAGAQIKLLQAIDECGSISKAAKLIGISYKTAWDRIDAMNNMSGKPLVLRSAGGVQGGGTALTPLGKQTVSGFTALQAEHDAFIQRIGSQLHSVEDLANFVRSGLVKTSARNQFRGEVSNMTFGAVNAEVEVRISKLQSLIAIITNDSAKQLNLEPGAGVIALVKASWVLLSPDVGVVTSARNKLNGKVSRITKGAVNSDITLDLGDGKSVSAIITNTSLEQLGLQERDPACALFKASSVILMSDI